MTYYAQHDPTLNPSPVTGWFRVRDTIHPDGVDYANLPPGEELFEVTQSEWDAHKARPSGWVIKDGVLTLKVPPT